MRAMLWLSILLLGGCSMKEAPVMKEYRLFSSSVPVSPSAHYAGKILKVSYPVAVNETLGDAMHYSYSPVDRGSYLNSRWANDIGRLLQGNTIQSLSHAKLFNVVVPYRSDLNEDLRLETVIFDFSHHVRGTASYAVVSIQCTLMNAKTGKLLKAKRFSYRENTSSTDAAGYVEATNRIVARLNRDMINWLR